MGQVLSICKGCDTPRGCDNCPDLHNWIVDALVEKAELQAYRDTGLEPEGATPMSEWISVKDRLPENAKHPGAFCPKYKVATKYGVTDGWYNPDRESWYVLFWFMTDRFLPSEIDFEMGDVPRVVRVSRDAGFVTHWMQPPQPPKEA